MSQVREFLMTEKNFSDISALVYKTCGIVLADHKKEMVYSRLTRRIRTLGLKSFDDYLSFLKQNMSGELSNFINAITTNLTSFFREEHHFAFLRDTVFKEIKQRNKSTRRARIWSAGCSTGEEPYSIGITCCPEFESSWDLKILATDLDSNVLAKGSNAIYESERLQGLDPKLTKRWFLSNPKSDSYKVKDEVRELISFKRLNLLSEWPMKGPFDVIFCRNVVIYFDNQTKNKLFERYAEMLVDGGYLFLGHSESMSRDNRLFSALGQTIYQKK